MTNPKQEPIETIDGCVAAALHILGNKWTALLIRDLSSGAKRFSELQRSAVGISPRTLSQRLVDLESHTIIIKKLPLQSSTRAVYSLTKKGHDLLPILRDMADWGEKYPKSCG